MPQNQVLSLENAFPRGARKSRPRRLYGFAKRNPARFQFPPRRRLVRRAICRFRRPPCRELFRNCFVFRRQDFRFPKNQVHRQNGVFARDAHFFEKLVFGFGFVEVIFRRLYALFRAFPRAAQAFQIRPPPLFAARKHRGSRFAKISREFFRNRRANEVSTLPVRNEFVQARKQSDREPNRSLNAVLSHTDKDEVTGGRAQPAKNKLLTV